MSMSAIATIRLQEADAHGSGPFAPDGAQPPSSWSDPACDEIGLDEAFGFSPPETAPWPLRGGNAAFGELREEETSFGPFAQESASLSIRDREPACDEFGDDAFCAFEIDEDFTAYLERALDEADDAADRAEWRIRRLGPPAGGVGVADPDAVMRLARARDAVGDFNEAVEAVVWQGGVSGDLTKRHSRIVIRLHECVRRIDRCEAKYAEIGVIS